MAQPHWSEPELWDLFDLSPMAGSGLQDYLDVTLNRCVQWFRASGGSIFWGEAESGVFALRAKCGQQMTLPDDVTVEVGKGIAGVVAEIGLPRIVADPTQDPDFARPGIQRRHGIASAMVIPLFDARQRVVGVLNISRSEGEQAFAEDDLEHGVTLAAHVALSVTNAQMVEDLQAQMEAARLTTEKLVAVLDSIAGAVVVMDGQGRVVNHNQAAMHESFLSPAPGVDLTALKSSLRETSKAVLSEKTPQTRRAYDPASDRTWLIQATPLSVGGAVITVQEVTEHDRSQRELSRVRRLAEIGQMTAQIAHEIRNPLTGIRSAAQMIAAHPETSTEYVQVIEEEVLKLNALCEEFLEFARPLTLHKEPQQLGQIVQRVTRLVEGEFVTKGVELDTEFDPNEPTIPLDARRIEQVVHNLLRNSLQATPTGGRVRVVVSEGTIVVEDTGVGMSHEQMDRLFSPFFTTKSDGTGLGLCTVRKIVDAHGGEIEIDSRPGEGSRFAVRLSTAA